KQPLADVRFTPKADKEQTSRHVRFVPQADICTAANCTLFDYLVDAGEHRLDVDGQTQASERRCRILPSEFAGWIATSAVQRMTASRKPLIYSVASSCSPNICPHAPADISAWFQCHSTEWRYNAGSFSRIGCDRADRSY